MIIGLFSELLGPGGVQRAGRQVAAVLAAHAQQKSESCPFLSLNDPPGENQTQVEGQDIRFKGFARAKLRFIWNAWRLAAENPRLVVAGHPNLAPVTWWVKTKSPGARAVVFTHGIEVWSPLPTLRRRALCQADLVLAPSNYTANKLAEEQAVPKEKIRQLAWGLDSEFLSGSAQPGNHLPPGQVILAVARLQANERYKGVEVLFQALHRIQRSVPDVHLVVVGDGDDRPRLERLATEMSLADKVSFLGFLEGEALRSWYRRCDVFALPSRGEGFGMVFLEAMTFRKPVVAGNYGAAPEIVKDGLNGFLVEQEDLDTLAERLVRLLGNERLRAQMGKAGQKWVAENYSFAQFRQRLTNLLDAAL